MRKVVQAIAFVFAALAIVSVEAISRSGAGGATIGEQIAARECAGCHGTENSKGTTIQGVYVPSFSEIANRPNQTKERLKAFVLIPRHPMPGLPIGEGEIRDLVEYIFSLRR